MNEFVDDKLEAVVEKLAEKKALTTVNNTLRCVLDKHNTEIAVLMKENQSLNSQYDQAFQINKQKNAECDSIFETLNNLREKIDNYRMVANQDIEELRDEETELKALHTHNQQQVNLQKNLWQDELRDQKEYLKELEEDNRLAAQSLKEYQTKHKYCTKLEHEKAEVFKEKNRVLSELMSSERTTLKATTNKRVFELTKNFSKRLDQRRISQAIDTTRGIIDLSSPKLLNTTINSKYGEYMTNYDSKARTGNFRSKRSSTAGWNNISHNSSRIY